MRLSILTLLISTGLNAAESPPPPGVIETWTCSYKPGKDIDDVLAARDYLVRQADRAGITLGPAYLWSLIKGEVPFDTLWLAPHADFAAFAAAADAQGGAAEMADVGARFDETGNCTARLGDVHTVFQKPGVEPTGDPVVISSFACTLKPGVVAEDIQDLRNHMRGTVDSLGDKAPNGIFTITPTTGGPNTPDFVSFSVVDSMTAYAEFLSAIRATGEGQSLVRHFNKILDCNQALWSSQQVITPAE